MKKYLLLIPLLALLIACHPSKPAADIKFPKDTLIGNKIYIKQNSEASLFSEITCPKCKHTKTEKLPTEVCLVSYTCGNCREVLHPKDDDCCVFCNTERINALRNKMNISKLKIPINDC